MLEIDILPASTDAIGADSILLRFGEFNYNGYPNDQTIVLIDGGYSDTSKQIIDHVKNIYRSDKIDCIVCTHPDADHINGLISLIESGDLEVDNICVHNPWNHAYGISRRIRDGRSSPTSVKDRLNSSLESLDDLLNVAAVNDIKPYEPFSGFKIYDVMTVLGPSKEYYQTLVKQYPGMHEARSTTSNTTLVPSTYNPNSGHFYKNTITSARNDSSTVILLHVEEFKILFTGDCGVEGLNSALKYAKENNINYQNPDYLQLPHHGSIKNISVDILNDINPKNIFVSAPSDSQKHPSRLTLNYLTKWMNLKVYKVSQLAIRISHNAPNRPGWGSTATPAPIYPTVYIPS